MAVPAEIATLSSKVRLGNDVVLKSNPTKISTLPNLRIQPLTQCDPYGIRTPGQMEVRVAKRGSVLFLERSNEEPLGKNVEW